MSGGTFDYKQYVISEIANSIEYELEIQGKPKPKEDLYMQTDFYEKYPEEKYFHTHSKEIQEKLREGIKILRMAAIYAHRIDYYLAGDDGEDSFLKRLKSDLNDFKGKKT
jgi:hypothetical protein